MLKYVKRGMYFIFLAISSIQFGCDEGVTPDPPQAYTFTVSGNIGSFWGEPKSNLRVTVDTNTVYTDAGGNFTIPDIAPPYDLNIFDTDKNSYYKLEGVNYDSVKFFTKLPESYSNQCYLWVTTTPSPLPNNIKAKYIFTDGKYLNAYGDANPSTGDYIRLRDYSLMTGRLYLIGYKTDASGKVVSYEKFGEKTVTLNSGGNVSVNFDTSEISFNPSETTVSGTFTNGTGTSNFGLVTLSFGKYETPNYATPLSFGGLVSGNNFSFLVPTNLPGLLKVRMYNESAGPDEPRQKMWVAVDPNSPGGTFALKEIPNLIEPSEGAVISNTTTFKFTGGNDADIYVVGITHGLNRYYLFTKSTEFTVTSFASLGISWDPGQVYSWNVSRIGEFYNVTNYILNPAILNSYESVSKTRTFVAQ